MFLFLCWAWHLPSNCWFLKPWVALPGLGSGLNGFACGRAFLQPGQSGFFLQRGRGSGLRGSRTGGRKCAQWASVWGVWTPHGCPAPRWLWLCMDTAPFSGPRADCGVFPVRTHTLKALSAAFVWRKEPGPAGLRAGADTPCSALSNKSPSPTSRSPWIPPSSSPHCSTSGLFWVLLGKLTPGDDPSVPVWDGYSWWACILSWILPALPAAQVCCSTLRTLILHFCCHFGGVWGSRKSEHMLLQPALKKLLFYFSCCRPVLWPKPAWRPKTSHTWGCSCHLQPAVMCAECQADIAHTAFQVVSRLAMLSSSHDAELLFFLRSVGTVGPPFPLLGCGHPGVGEP